MGKTRTIVCGVDGSPGGRTAVRVAALLARKFDARLIAVHVLDRLMTSSETAERAAATILFEEAPDAVQRRGARSVMWRSSWRLSRAVKRQR